MAGWGVRGGGWGVGDEGKGGRERLRAGAHKREMCTGVC